VDADRDHPQAAGCRGRDDTPRKADEIRLVRDGALRLPTTNLLSSTYSLTYLLPTYFLTRCAMILSDPTSLAQTHPALHALLAQLAAASLASAAAVSSE